MPAFPYSPEAEQLMKAFYDMLNERDRRLYAAIEALKLGYGGQAYISRLLGCDEKTIRRGIEELHNPPPLLNGRIRRRRTALGTS
jgi:hypothetical protein